MHVWLLLASFIFRITSLEWQLDVVRQTFAVKSFIPLCGRILFPYLPHVLLTRVTSSTAHLACILVHALSIIVIIVELSLDPIHIVALESLLIASCDYRTCLARLGQDGAIIR